MKKRLLLLLAFVSVNAFAQLPVEGFEGNWPPTGWAVVNVGGTQETWQQSDPSSPFLPPYEGVYAAQLNSEDVATGATEDWLISPQFTIPVMGQISFFSRLSQIGDQGNTYKVLLSTSPDQLAIGNYILLQEWTETQINPSQQEYTPVTVILPEIFVGMQGYIAFVMEGDGGDDWIIDNVQLTSGGCVAPTNLTVTNVTPTSAALSWTGNGTETMWEIEIGFNGAPITGAGVVTTANPYIVTGLTEAGCYHFYVRSICSTGMTSTWSGPIDFCTTPCDPVNQCMFTFNLTDTGGDGWNNNTISVTQNGFPVAQLNLAEGASSSVQVPMCSDVPYELYWNGGGLQPEEIGITVLNSFGQIVYTKPAGTGQPDTLLFTGTPNCEVEDCMFAPGNLSAIVQNTDAILSWEGPMTNIYEYYVVTEGSPAPVETTEGTTVTGNEAVVTDLSVNTNYSFYVRTVCFSGESPWSEPYNFSIGTGNSVSGTLMIDVNNDNNCNDQDVAVPNAEMIATVNGGTPFSIYTSTAGTYLIDDLPAGVNQISLQPVASQLFTTVDPIIQSVDFTTDPTLEIPVCVPATAAITDVSVTLIPVGFAQPGFNAGYTLLVWNQSYLPAQNVTVTLTFDDARLDFLSMGGNYTITGNTITIDLGTVAPLSPAYLNPVFYVLPPMTNIGGETLWFTADVSMTATDDEPADNTHSLSQIIVNSYDPNDITCHEGATITEDQADNYLTYTIRFQNTGTANAVNVRLENTLDELLDWDTFEPIAGSHEYYVTREDGQLEFMFDNIQLPAEEDDEPASHGYVTYRIKPIASFGLGDIVSNTAEIYFDFNPAIVTNTATTEVVTTMGRGEFAATNVMLYPNPVNDKLHIQLKDGELLSVKVYDMNGREFNAVTQNNILDSSALMTGMYLVKITTSTGTSVQRIIKR